MVFRTLSFIVFIFSVLHLAAQSPSCAMEERMNSDKEKYLFEKYIHSIKNNPLEKKIRSRSEKWLPVVVHVVTNDPQSVSYAQVVHQIEVLNNDFAKKSNNILKLREEFRDLAADTEIRFCLASVDPEGNPTNGVTYTTTELDNIALERDMNGRYVVYYDQLGGKTGWDHQRYINIWVAEYGNSILGYGSLPGTAPYPEEIGLVIDPSYFGSLGHTAGSSQYTSGHTLTHEMGHFLGLLHIWGVERNSCTDSDEVEDTPNADGAYVGCPSGVRESCGVSNMYQNFMDMTDDRCLAAFTHGQSQRMHTTLDLFYPEMAQSVSCQNTIAAFDAWLADVVWAFDAESRQYVLYHNDIYSGSLQIDVYSIDGKRLISQEVNSLRSYFIDLNGVAAGVYLVRLSNDESYETRKIVVY